MRVALLNGPIPYKNAITHTPLELSYIAGMLKQKGYDVRGFDFAILPKDQHKAAEHEIMSFRPDIIFTTFSRVLFDTTSCMSLSIPLLKSLKEHLSVMHVCAIGEHATFRPDITLAYPFVDSLIRFSPELASVRLAETLANRGDTDSVLGVLTKKNLCDKAIDQNWALPLESLDPLGVPLREVFPIDLYLAQDSETIVETSRGCTHKCRFCQRARYHAEKTYRSISVVLEDVRHCLALGFNSIFFTDLDFCMDKERTVDVCQAILREKTPFRWTCNIRADLLDHPDHLDILRTMQEAGCYRVFVGLESANDEVLRKVSKGISSDYGIRLKAVLDSIGIKLHASFLVGLPDDTLETMEATLSYAKKINADVVSINSLTPLPGTPYGDDPTRFGLTLLDSDEKWFEDPNKVSRQVCGNTSLSAEEIQKWLPDAYMRLFCD